MIWGALALAVFAALTHWRARRNEARARKAFPPSGAFLTIDGTRVHYLKRGAGPPIVLIHGASGNLRDFSFDLMDRLAQDYTVIAFDRPGLGYTDRLHDRGASLQEQADLLAKATGALGVEKPIVLGQSYGGAVALAWAVHHPDSLSALVLLAAPSCPWTGPPPMLYRVNTSPLAPLTIPLLAAWVPDAYVDKAIAEVFTPQDEPPGYAAHIGAALTLRRHSLRENALHRAQLLDEITRLAPRYDEITVPIELLHGDQDTTVGLPIHSAPFAREYPDAHLTVLHGVGHMPHHARPSATLEAVHRAARRARLR
ncbi:alpha/beta fold hydrolase [Tropicibacter naphthalenivorans]|uniref:Dihydrolipoyllysine-residue acetyltransferase component of acetoin cleaving system n=1 Tax=Tropicibacter naphthalenivorans TaxID=441103 RepID=A0A0P1GT80_9RHOB|nr:alpha/beta hydrolase [Tropicibacter naphthalenivorans]CUH77276.1 Dihydrolipoyllysine-residue acetyltransferase component of acetoin cleaving system [Tropicibacter naphthalenivorans]SMC59284.1 Pimeloyl-ACP methyl ester carboxylesterase [Tropicibacter naphthalenivorans]